MPRLDGGVSSSGTSRKSLRGAPSPIRGRRPGLMTCRMKVSLPPSTWLHSITVAHPDLRVEVLDRLLLTGQLMLTEARLHGPRFSEVVRELERSPAVEQVEVLEGDTSSALVRVTHRAPHFMTLFRELRVLRRFPFWVENGIATWVVVASGSKLRQLLRGLSRGVPQLQVEAIQPTKPDSKHPLLTRREGELFRRAMSEGYFDVPRKVSLTELARRVNLAKSTLSRTLAVVERKLLSESGEALSDSTFITNPPEPVR
jgi:predicted DNA binding protein